MRDAVGPFSAFEASHDERNPEADASLLDGLRRDTSACGRRLTRLSEVGIDFGYFCAGKSWRHPGVHFFKSSRFVLTAIIMDRSGDWSFARSKYSARHVDISPEFLSLNKRHACSGLGCRPEKHLAARPHEGERS